MVSLNIHEGALDAVMEKHVIMEVLIDFETLTNVT